MIKSAIKSLKISVFFIAFLFIFSSYSHAATLSLDPAEETIEAGDSIAIDVLIDSDFEEVSGVDAIILFDAGKLDVDTAELSDLFPNVITESVSYGKVIFQATADNDPYIGIGDVFATIHFNAIADGDANIDIKFIESGDTTDSNITSSLDNSDLLEQVDNAVITINESGNSTTTSTSSDPGGDSTTVTTKKTTTPVSGHVENTIAILVGGVVAASSGFYLKKRQSF